MKLDEIQAAEARLLLSTYDRNPILFVGGEGVHIIDENGRSLSRSAQRHRRQRARIQPSGDRGGHRPAEPRADPHLEPLLSRGPGGTGAAPHRAHRARPRLLRQHRHRGLGGRAEAGARVRRPAAQRRQAKIGTKFLALEQSFHGRTFGSMSTTYKAKYREPFAPVVPGVEFVRFNDVADLRAKFSSEVCAILVEAIQGEGGVRPLTQEFFAEARALANSTGALLIVDEIQAGMGRTGKWCAYQHYGIQPDVTTLAKPLAGGIPWARCCARKKSRARCTPACTARHSAAGHWPAPWPSPSLTPSKKKDLLAHATEVGDYFQERLRWLATRHEAIVDVRGKGLMVAAELDSAELAKLTVAEMLKRHILINCTSDTVLRFLPPYILERAHVDTAIAALDEIFTEHAAAQHAAPPQEDNIMASRATMERTERAVPVEKDPDVLAAAARMAGEDHVFDRRSFQRRGARHPQARPRRQAQSARVSPCARRQADGADVREGQPAHAPSFRDRHQHHGRQRDLRRPDQLAAGRTRNHRRRGDETWSAGWT